MEHADLERYWKPALEGWDGEGKVIHPSGVVTAPWVRLKCQFGCTGYGKGYCCPPETPRPEEMRAILDAYRRAILFHIRGVKGEEGSRRQYLMRFFDRLVTLEGEMFKEGFYKAFVLLAGPCELCKQCTKQSGKPCVLGFKARPSMEACGIDVYQTARNNGFFIQPLREKGETQNCYCLMLVD